MGYKWTKERKKWKEEERNPRILEVDDLPKNKKHFVTVWKKTREGTDFQSLAV